MAGGYDEAVGRLRRSYQLDLSNVFDENDLRNEFEKLKSGERPKARQNLINNTESFFDYSSEVQDQVTDNFNSEINKSGDSTQLSRVRDFSTIRDRGKVQGNFDGKAFDFIPKADSNELVDIERDLMGKVSNKGLFDLRITERKNKLIEDKGANITRAEIQSANLDALKSVRKFSSRLGISEDTARNLLVKEGYTLYDNDRRFK